MSKGRADTGVLDAILHANQGRKPDLLRRKLRLMRADPFTFFRGADPLFCRAWPELRPGDVGPEILITGDLHLENFGAHRTTDGEFRFDINDFDESAVAPCSFDLVRCATSIILAAEAWSLLPSHATGMALAFLDKYRKALLAAVKKGSVHEIVPHGGHGPIQEILGSTAIATQTDLLKAKTRRKASGKILISRDESRRDVSRKQFDSVAAAVETHGRRVRLPDAYKVHDVVFRIAGVGSLGVRRYLALVEGDGPPHGNRLLDVKEALPSSIAPCASDGDVDQDRNAASRMVRAQIILQGHVAVGLDSLTIGRRSYRIREMIPAENRSSLDRFKEDPVRLRRAVEKAGELTAWSQLRGARFQAEIDRWPELKQWVSGPALDSILTAAARFTERTNREHAELRRSIRDRGGIAACLQSAAH
jgi:uncharacterized protein (DUF2252 family)